MCDYCLPACRFGSRISVLSGEWCRLVRLDGCCRRLSVEARGTTGRGRIAKASRGRWKAVGRRRCVCTPAIAARPRSGGRGGVCGARPGLAAVWRRRGRFGLCAGWLGAAVGAAFGRGRRLSAGRARLPRSAVAVWALFAAGRWRHAAGGGVSPRSPILGEASGVGGGGAAFGGRRPGRRTSDGSKRGRRCAAARRVAAALSAVRARLRHWLGQNFLG